MPHGHPLAPDVRVGLIASLYPLLGGLVLAFLLSRLGPDTVLMHAAGSSLPLRTLATANPWRPLELLAARPM
jgi:hypothetical protein